MGNENQRWNLFGFPNPNWVGNNPNRNKEIKVQGAKLIRQANIGQSQSGKLHAFSTNTFNISNASAKGYELQDMKNISLILSPGAGFRTKVVSAKLIVSIEARLYQSADRYPFRFYPLLINLENGGSIATTETNLSSSLESAITAGITGNYSLEPLNVIQPQVRSINFNSSDTAYFFKYAEVEFDITAALNKFLAKNQNQPTILNEPSIHLCGVLVGPDCGTDINVRSMMVIDADTLRRTL